jgi:hypothetical protein
MDAETATPIETRRPVTIGGKTWMIPRMGVKQLRLLQGKFDAVVKAVITDNTPFGKLSEAQLDDMTFCIWVAVNRADPSFTQEQFDNLETSIEELAIALLPISLQVLGYTPDKPPPAPATEPAAQAA